MKPSAEEMGKCVHIKVSYTTIPNSGAGVTDLLNTVDSFK